MQIFYGLAAPPTSYGGYGGNAKEAAKCARFIFGGAIELGVDFIGLMLVLIPCRYTFEYPTGWKIDTIGKVRHSATCLATHSASSYKLK